MLKIKHLRLQNYAGYREVAFDFIRDDGSFKPICALYGPNGCGKSNCLYAINLLGQAKQFIGRDNDLIFRKMIYHPDYDPTLPHFAEYQHDMRIEGIFDIDGEEKKVIVTGKGVEINELTGFRNMVYIDADHPMNMKKFQIPSERTELFLDMAREIYGYEPSLGKPVQTFEKNWDGREDTHKDFANGTVEGMSVTYYQDFILDKGDTKVHFKSMSDGERKIATVLRNLCDPSMIDRSDIVLIDNIELHVFMERHAPMVLKFVENFPTKQFIVTTHSAILIGLNSPKLGIHIPSFVGERFGTDCLFDVHKLKGQTFSTRL